jgi:hypothetical protein
MKEHLDLVHAVTVQRVCDREAIMMKFDPAVVGDGVL